MKPIKTNAMKNTSKKAKGKPGYSQPQGHTLSNFEWFTELILKGLKVKRTKKGIFIYK